MRKISKAKEPEGFIKWKEHQALEIQSWIEDEQMSAGEIWDNKFPSRPLPIEMQEIDYPQYSKQELRESLVREQGYLCCYCLAGITSEHPSAPIEHFLPKSIHRSLIFDYKNLHASCVGMVRNAKRSDSYKSKLLNCDASKGPYDPGDAAYSIVSPLEEHCEALFVFGADGQIQAVEENGERDPRAKETIKVLNLDNENLRKMRLEAFFAFIFELEDNNLSFEELMLELESLIDSDRPLPFYPSIIASLQAYYGYAT